MGKSKGKHKKSNSSNNNNNSNSNNKSTKKNPASNDYDSNNNSGKGNGKKNKKTKKGSKYNQNNDYTQDDYSFRQKLTNNNEREIIEMAADGNCLFRSISHQLYNDYGQRHDVVRQEICDYLEQNEDDFKVYLLLEDSGESDDVCEFDSYVEQMRKDGEWGGDVEIVCAARLYKRTVTIYSNVGAYNVSIDAEEEKLSPNMLLSYHDNMHYNSVLDLKANNNSTKSTKAVDTVSSSVSNDATGASKGNKKKANKKAKKVQKTNDEIKTGDNSESQTAAQSIEQQPTTVNTENEFESKQTEAEGKKLSDLENTGNISKKKNGPKRNDQCPCGSGLRYKKCCLAKEKNKIRLEKFREKHGLQTDADCVREDQCADTAKRSDSELEGGFAILNI